MAFILRQRQCLLHGFHLFFQDIRIAACSVLLKPLNPGLHSLQIQYVLHRLYQVIHGTADTMLEAFIRSGVHTDGLVEAHIIFDHLSVFIILCIFLVIFYGLAIHGSITLEVMLRPQISLYPVTLLIGYPDLTLIVT